MYVLLCVSWVVRVFVCCLRVCYTHTHISIHEPIHPSLHQLIRPIAIFAGLLALLHRVGVEVDPFSSISNMRCMKCTNTKARWLIPRR
jgi:hypothetical protein